MNLNDYIIEHSAFDWQALMTRWRWLLPERFTAWIMNRFGDLFLQTEDGKVHWLRLDDGTLTCIADSKEQFLSKIEEAEVAADWLMIPIVDRLVAAGKIVRQGECYSFVKIPMIGGDYTVENVEVREITDIYPLLGQAFEQMKDLPDGTPVEFIYRK